VVLLTSCSSELHVSCRTTSLLVAASVGSPAFWTHALLKQQVNAIWPERQVPASNFRVTYGDMCSNSLSLHTIYVDMTAAYSRACAVCPSLHGVWLLHTHKEKIVKNLLWQERLEHLHWFQEMLGLSLRRSLSTLIRGNLIKRMLPHACHSMTIAVELPW